MISLQDLRWMIEDEGASYVLRHKIGLDQIEDATARELATTVKDALNAFLTYVETNTEGEWDG